MRKHTELEGDVVVVGSANLDVVVAVPRVPRFGETIFGLHVSQLPGGKGLNQAIAASCARARTSFVGAVGEDPAGVLLAKALSDNGVVVDHLRTVPDCETGTAHIVVASAGENQIVVVAGANDEVEECEAVAALEEYSTPVVLVLQGEIPLKTSTAAASMVENRGGRVVFNLAPAQEAPAELLAVADPLVVNEHEAGVLLNIEVPSDAGEAIDAARRLAAVSRSVILTLGSQGAVVWVEGHGSYLPPDPTNAVVDTTGAGDAFVGVLAAQLSKGDDLLSAASIANKAAAATIEHHGASESYQAIRSLFGQRDDT